MERETARTISRRVDGVELVRATIRVFAPRAAWAAELAEEAVRFVDETLVPLAKEQFENDPSPQKRFFFRRFLYELRVFEGEEADGVRPVYIRASLSRGNEGVIAETERVISLRASDGKLLPPKKRKKRHPDAPL